MNPRAITLAVAAGVALADASIVTLALPEILRDLDTSVEGVAAVIGVYTAVLAIALVPLERLAARHSTHLIGAGGFALLAVAGIVCASAQSMPVLLAGRCVQALGGAAGLATVFELLGGGEGRGRRLWVAAAVYATALGPAVGGALTQAFSWRAIFVFQVPVAAAGALAVMGSPAHPAPALPDEPERPEPFRPALALALVSAALSAVLFLLVLLLVAGWNVTPLSAAVTVTVIPLGAAIGAQIEGRQRERAAAGAALVGGGVLALAWLPGASLLWTVPPQLLAGVGMGLAFTALAGGLLPERTPRDAARLLAIRHAGIAAILAVAAPIAAHQLNVATETARERGVALVLDSPLPPLDKIKLAPALLKGVQSSEPRNGLRDAVAAERHRFSGADLVAYDNLGQRADDTLVSAVGDAFRSSFLIAGAAGFIAALLLLAGVRLASVAVAGALAIGTPVVYALLYRTVPPKPPAILDPCTAKRTTPQAGGITGFIQAQALKALDQAACRLGSSREELVLALADDQDAKRFQKEHGVNPRSVGGLIQKLLGGG
jgi:drug/metabolite transporter (DMT)-like permease